MRKIYIRRVQLSVLSGPEKGMTWLMETDVIRIGSADTEDIVLTDPTVTFAFLYETFWISIGPHVSYDFRRLKSSQVFLSKKKRHRTDVLFNCSQG